MTRLNAASYLNAMGTKELPVHLAILDYLREVLPDSHMVFHTPNGGARDAVTGAKLKRMGVVAGVPDLAIIRPAGRIAFIEIKGPSGSESASQRAFKLFCATWGVPYAVCRSVDDARTFLAHIGIETKETA